MTLLQRIYAAFPESENNEFAVQDRHSLNALLRMAAVQGAEILFDEANVKSDGGVVEVEQLRAFVDGAIDTEYRKVYLWWRQTNVGDWWPLRVAEDLAEWAGQRVTERDRIISVMVPAPTAERVAVTSLTAESN